MKSILLTLLALCAFSCVNPSMDQGKLLSFTGNAAMMQPINQGKQVLSVGNAAGNAAMTQLINPGPNQGTACACCSPRPTPF